MTGTAVRGARRSKTYNRRLDHVQQGGNPRPVQHPEFVRTLRRSPRSCWLAGVVHSPVDILAPSHRLFTTPNRITKADFDGWVEQRGSKFFTEWDAAYTPLIATHDQGQEPQKGGWLTAVYGKGHYTYFAYAFHRQLPYGVPGAYRLLANLLSRSRQPACDFSRWPIHQLTNSLLHHLLNGT